MKGSNRLYVLALGFSLLIAACEGGDGEGRRYLDQEYATPCEALHAISKFALKLHLTRRLEEFDLIREQAARALADDLDATSPKESFQECKDLQAIRKEKNLNEKELFYKALKKFVSLLDPHSRYLTPEEEKVEWRQAKNQFYGIGVEFQKRLVDFFQPVTSLVVEEVFSGSPAAGYLDPGDRITAINGTSLKDPGPVAPMNFSRALKFMRVDAHSVDLEVNGSESVTLKRAQYDWSPVMFDTLELGDFFAGYIKVREFTKGVSELFRTAVDSLEREHVEGFVIDLRMNPGGRVKDAKLIIDDLTTSVGVAVTTQGHPKKNYPDDLNPNVNYRTESSEQITDLPVVLLVDAYSASSTEILAAALWRERAIVAGDRTFGKGTGQYMIPLSVKNGFGGLLVLTMFRIYLSDGFSPQIAAVSPHLGLEIPDAELERVIAERRARKEPTLLREADYDRVCRESERECRGPVISAAGSSHQSTTGDVLSQMLNEIRAQASEGEYKRICKENDRDCPLKTATAYLRTASEVSPKILDAVAVR